MLSTYNCVYKIRQYQNRNRNLQFVVVKAKSESALLTGSFARFLKFAFSPHRVFIKEIRSVVNTWLKEFHFSSKINYVIT